MAFMNLTEPQFRELVITFEGNGKALAEHLGVTPSAVSARLKNKNKEWWAEYKQSRQQKYNLLKQARAEEFRAIVVRHRGDLDSIAKELGIQRATVYAKLNGAENAEWWSAYRGKTRAAEPAETPATPRANYQDQVMRLVLAIQNKGCTNEVFESSCSEKKLCGLCQLKKERDEYKSALLSISETISNL
jgi:predicted transcriptional regulator